MSDITDSQRAELERRGWRHSGEQWQKRVEPPAGNYLTGAVWWGAHTASWVATGHMSLLMEFAAITGQAIPGYVVVPAEDAALIAEALDTIGYRDWVTYHSGAAESLSRLSSLAAALAALGKGGQTDV